MTTQQGELGGDVGTLELRGKVKWFNAVKGYGFLALDSDNSDAFLHVTTLRQAGHEDDPHRRRPEGAAGRRNPRGVSRRHSGHRAGKAPILAQVS